MEYLIIGVICGVICVAINKAKNRGNEVLAFAGGFFFGFFGVLVNVCLSEVTLPPGPVVPEQEKTNDLIFNKAKQK